MLAAKQILFGVLLIIIYALGILVLKENFYVGWTWRGFVADYKTVITFLVFLSPPILLVWGIYTKHTPGESLIDSVRRLLVGPFLWLALLMEVFIAAGLAYLAIGSSPTVSKNLDFHLAQHNWTYADEELKRLRGKPIREDILFALEHYIDSHRRSNGNDFKDGQYHRAQRIAVKRAIEASAEMRRLNILSYAELSKIIFFVEDRNPAELEEAKGLLLTEARNTVNKEEAGQYYLKAGDLLLAAKNYQGAKAIYDVALSFLEGRVSISVCLANLGNIFAATGKHNKAAQLYREAEVYYPEGRRDVFYSNYGYLLMLAGKLEEAEKAVRNALAINTNDWYSYLNLALIYDAQGQYSDAIKSYDEVISKTTKGDFLREAKLLKAYSLIKGLGNERKGFLVILNALGRSPDIIDRLIASQQDRYLTYLQAAQALKDTNTHGIEKYIIFFEEKAKENHQTSGAS